MTNNCNGSFHDYGCNTEGCVSDSVSHLKYKKTIATRKKQCKKYQHALQLNWNKKKSEIIKRLKLRQKKSYESNGWWQRVVDERSSRTVKAFKLICNNQSSQHEVREMIWID